MGLIPRGFFLPSFTVISLCRHTILYPGVKTRTFVCFTVDDCFRKVTDVIYSLQYGMSEYLTGQWATKWTMLPRRRLRDSRDINVTLNEFMLSYILD